MLTKDQLQRLVLNTDADTFCDRHLFGPSAWLFANRDAFGIRGSYVEFKKSVADSVHVRPDCIGLVGSAKLGYSLSPEAGKRLLRDFGTKSDIDVVIVSDELFDEIWSHFHQAYYAGYRWIEDNHGGDIFRKFIVLASDYRYPESSTYLRDVSVRLMSMRRDVQSKHSIRNKVNYRIYESWDAAHTYHAWSIGKLQERLRKNA